MRALWPTLLLPALCLGGCLEEPDVAVEGQAAQSDRYAEPRREMVAHQLRARGIGNTKVLAAMERVPRHEFVPPLLRGLAYGDRPLPIGHGQTISQPYIVAFMTEALNPAPTDRVLEIGTGSGYQAAVLAELVAKVYTIEIVQPLGARAAPRPVAVNWAQRGSTWSSMGNNASRSPNSRSSVLEEQPS